MIEHRGKSYLTLDDLECHLNTLPLKYIQGVVTFDGTSRLTEERVFAQTRGRWINEILASKGVRYDGQVYRDKNALRDELSKCTFECSIILDDKNVDIDAGSLKELAIDKIMDKL
jgi:hypothetical protein